MCFLGMVGIATSFIVQRINDEVKMSTPFGDGKKQGGALSYMLADHSKSALSKSTAMLLCFTYAALAWIMSNGIVANPRACKWDQ